MKNACRRCERPGQEQENTIDSILEKGRKLRERTATKKGGNNDCLHPDDKSK